MADYYPQIIGSSERMYAPFHTTSSMQMHPVMETPALSTASVFPMNLTWSASRMQQACPSPPDNSIVVTPPADGPTRFPPPPYPYPSWSNFDSPQQNMSMASTTIHSDCYFDSSSLENSPLSSPGSADSAAATHEVDEMLYCQSPPSLPISTSTLCDNFYSPVSLVQTSPYESASCSIYSRAADSPIMVPTTGYDAPARVYSSPMSGRAERAQEHAVEHVQKEIKMPQRKGGIQLWQFLYSLLSNPEKKYGDIIQWTSNKHQQEFRMLEPESIAVWWGHHKNKPGMTYEKFSRSLRYYYDKGILKKIPGEKFVYRFMIDPEVMYHHIGTSDCRPKIKPMPKAAKAAMSKFQKSQNISFKPEDAPIITPEPEVLVKDEVPTSQSCNVLQVATFCRSNSDGFTRDTLQVGSSLHISRSTGKLAQYSTDDVIPPIIPIQRCQSLENTHTNWLAMGCSPAKREYQAHSILTQVNDLIPNNQYFSN